MVRIYPVLVVKNTKLEKEYEDGVVQTDDLTIYILKKDILEKMDEEKDEENYVE